MPLIVRYQYGHEVHECSLDWLPTPEAEYLFVAIDPATLPPPQWHGTVMRGFCWQHNGEQHLLYFSPPRNAGVVRDVSMWRSDSHASAALYPWWWNLCNDFSNCSTDIILQILPAWGVTSLHSHRVTEQEDYVPLLPDGHTIMWHKDSEHPLVEPVCVLPREPHQLRRPHQKDFSVQLLRMVGPIRFPNRSDHHSVTEAEVSAAMS